ncbi:DUF1987 domain-containing protein [Geobacter sp. FeAm09]|uniref:DUF1987 domain-containing protein n=1 Tax=Geobacter sp. FeAm09 TaxID=2597769 RepID=UPI0011EBF2BC|nr:DUF1987 domain-containing protein [Geobacter sp. FeAm09]QEM69299.1 DUF1987 domain-containing protein [Geobacter sp. FeAm09]
MNMLDMPQSSSTPLIRFDLAERKMRISGESYPENSFGFYAPVFDWVKEYLAGADELHLDIDISYMNSSSTKCVLDLLDLLEDAHARGAKVDIVWRYDTENPRSLDLAEEFQEEVTLPFSIVAATE